MCIVLENLQAILEKANVMGENMAGNHIAVDSPLVNLSESLSRLMDSYTLHASVIAFLTPIFAYGFELLLKLFIN